MSYIGIIITYVFVQNFILVQFMGLCPFIGVSKNSESALGMGMAVTFVTAVASVVCYMVFYFFSFHLDLSILRL
ncbi:Rnf-Nqr domain containing protein [Bullifex porci]|nr:Rnf-Nqr domain containing protein [Bullifex porci]